MGYMLQTSHNLRSDFATVVVLCPAHCDSTPSCLLFIVLFAFLWLTVGALAGSQNNVKGTMNGLHVADESQSAQ